jgi:hypothetical protein
MGANGCKAVSAALEVFLRTGYLRMEAMSRSTIRVMPSSVGAANHYDTPGKVRGGRGCSNLIHEQAIRHES